LFTPNSRRIIEPLASRCSKFRFTPLNVAASRERLEHIAQAEGVSVSSQAIDALIRTSEGDLRRSITYLQSASRLSMATDPPAPITPAEIHEIAGVVPDRIVRTFLAALGVEMAGSDENAMDVDDGPIKARRVRGFDDVRDEVMAIVQAGYSTAQLISQVNTCLDHAEPHSNILCIDTRRNCNASHPFITSEIEVRTCICRS
jgi:replication factor C subunit 2/4